MTNDSKMKTGSGRVIKAGHDCEMPSGQTVNAVFRCDCGRYWQLRQTMREPRWMVEAVFRGWHKL